MTYNLNNKHALICGSSQGIGEAIAKKFAQTGCLVSILARNEKKLSLLKSELDKLNNKNITRN